MGDNEININDIEEKCNDACKLLDKCGYAVKNLWHIVDILKLYPGICPGCASKYLNEALQHEDVLKMVYVKFQDIIDEELKKN